MPHKNPYTCHELKSWPEIFDRLWKKSKTFDLRKNDRDFQVGDYVKLREWRPCASCQGVSNLSPPKTSFDVVKTNSYIKPIRRVKRSCLFCGGKGTTHDEPYTGRLIEAKITYILEDQPGLVEGYVVLNLVVVSSVAS